MPGKVGKKNIGSNIKEFHEGPTYQKTKAKFGKDTADKQAIAVGISESKRKKK